MLALRLETPVEMIAAFNSLVVPPDAETEAEMIAIAYVHSDAKVRSKAVAWLKKHVADADKLKSTFKQLHSVGPQDVEDRLRALPGADSRRVAIATAMAAHGDVGQAIAFEADVEFMRSVLARMITTHEGRATLHLSEIQPYPGQAEYETKGSGEMRLAVIPSALFDELPKLRAEHPFDSVVLKSSLLETLPPRFAELGAWLRGLTLQFNENMRSIPAVVFGFGDLESLSVHSRVLTEIPGQIGVLKSLTKLELTHARKLKTFPAELFSLDKLRLLSLRDTGIEKLPREIGQLQALEELNLMETPLTELPTEVGELKKLKRLSIRWSEIDAERARAIVGPDVELEV